MATNTVAFPSDDAAPQSLLSSQSSVETRPSTLSLRQTTALEICDMVYGASVPSWDAIERFYESNATYENPLVTATSRSVIADIHSVASQLAQLDVPRPLAVLYTLFGVNPEAAGIDPVLFRLVRVWSETGDVCESESFDGHRKVIVEHTLNVLILPGLHSAGECYQPSQTPSHALSMHERTLSLPSTNSALQHLGQSSTLGLHLSIPSPLHLRLPIISRLSFNDAGKITYHRDLWDVKDLLGLIPGMTLAQWISGRMVAQGFRGLTWFASALLGTPSAREPPHSRRHHKHPRDEETGLSSAAAFAKAVKERAANEVLTPPADSE